MERRSDAKEALEELGESIIKQIEKKENPYITVPVRSISNVIYDEKNVS